MANDIDSQALADSRGVVPPNEAIAFRDVRAAEMWDRFDSYVVGVGASKKDSNWSESWQDFANADKLEWFSGRNAAAGASYTNQTTERSDWAQDLYQTRVEFIAPPGMADLETDSNDIARMPILFTQALASMMAFRITLAESDDILKAPGTHLPGGLGTTIPMIASAASTTVTTGTNGEAIVSNCWKWPEPIMLAAKAKLTVTAVIDSPIKDLLRNIAGPGSKLVPKNDGSGTYYSMPNWYVIRISHWGPRYLQLRGARSSA